jgi:hypothetical protein
MKMIEKRKITLLNKCVDAVLAGKVTLSECIKHHPEISDELRVALKVHRSFSSLSAQRLPPAEIQRRKALLLSRLTSRERTVTTRPDFRYLWQITERRFAMSWIVIIATFIALIGGGGTVYASESALPGDALYPVKIWVEDARLALGSETGAAGLGITLLDKRMNEMAALIDEGRSEDLDELAVQYQNRTNLVTQAIARLQAENPEEATRYRLLLQERLQEHARMMARYTENWEEHLGARVQTWMREMLQTHQQTQLRPSENEEALPPGEPLMNQNANQNQVQNNGPWMDTPPGQFFDEGGLKFRFRSFSGTEGGVYAEISGQRYGCSTDQEEIVCNLTSAPEEGTMAIYNYRGDLLFSTAYTYRWQGQNSEQENPEESQNLWLWSGEKNDAGQGSGNQGGKSDGGN